MRYLLIVLSFHLGFYSISQTVFNETIGSPAGTTPVGTYNGYSNFGSLTFSGTADVRNTAPSAGYVGVSGNGNVFFTSTSGINFEISAINTSSYTSLSLSFGHLKTTTASNNELIVEVSSDGITYSPLTYSRPTGTGTANSWLLINPTGTIPSVSNLRIRFRQTSTSSLFRIDDIKLTGTLIAGCSNPIEPSIEASSVTNSTTCTSANLNWTNGNGLNRLVLLSTSPISTAPSDGTNYTASSIFGSGGSIIGGSQVIYNSNGSTVTITGLASGTTYNYAIYEYNLNLPNCSNYMPTGITGSFTTLTGCGPSTPQLLGLLANSCSTDEGLNEFFVFQNGTSPQSLSTMTVNFPSFTYCNSSCGTQTLLNNATAITALNTAAGCALFTFADPIPASATVVVFTGNPPTAPPNFSAQCGQTYYAIFCNNPADVSGRFANSGTGTRTLSVNFGATTDAVTYDLATISNTDGAYVAFDYAGNPFYSVISNCAGPLGLDLLQWKGSYSESGNVLEWKTTNESNVSHFEVLKLNDQNKFEVIDQLPANNTKLGGNYFSIDREHQNTAFYQLKSVDQNGSYTLSPILKVDAIFENMLIGFNNGHFVSNDWEQIEVVRLFNMNGQAVFSTTKNELLNANQTFIPTGMYVLQVTKRNGEQFTQKLPVNAF